LRRSPDGDGGQTVLGLPRFESDQVVLGQVNFRRVFDEEDTFIGQDELPEYIEHRSFSGSGTPSDENVFSRLPDGSRVAAVRLAV
jgi:hypothetical protein